MDAEDKAIERIFGKKFQPKQRLVVPSPDNPQGRLVIQLPDWEPEEKDYQVEIDFQLPERAQEWIDMLSGDERRYAEAVCNWIMTNSPIPKAPWSISSIKAMLLFYHAQSVCGNLPIVFLKPERGEDGNVERFKKRFMETEESGDD
jgi:hypothetical protein